MLSVRGFDAFAVYGLVFSVGLHFLGAQRSSLLVISYLVFFALRYSAVCSEEYLRGGELRCDFMLMSLVTYSSRLVLAEGVFRV